MNTTINLFGNRDIIYQKQIRTETRLVTPELAKQCLTVNAINRKPKKVLIDYYASEMKAGRWGLTGEALIFSDTHKLLDGQNSLYAVISANVPIEFLVVYNVKESNFTNLNQGGRRSARDVFQIAGIKNHDVIVPGLMKMSTLSRNIASRLGTNTYTSESSTVLKLSSDKMLEINNEYSEFFHELSTKCLWLYRKFKYLSKADYFGYIAYLTIHKKHNYDSVVDFFTQLGVGGSYVKNESIYKLRDKLYENAISKQKYTGLYRDAIIAKTWNAFVLNKTIKILTFNNEKEQKPELI